MIHPPTVPSARAARDASLNSLVIRFLMLARTTMGPLATGRMGRTVRRGLGNDAGEPDGNALDSLQRLLRIADTWPSGRPGSEIRRAACDLIESNSRWRRARSRRRLRACVARVQQRRASGRSRSDDPSAAQVDELVDALRREISGG
jgi:hypothetical protein